MRDQEPGIYGLRAVDVTTNCSGPIDPGKEYLYGYYGNTNSNWITASSQPTYIELNKWINVIYTYDGTKAQLYLNGVLKETRNGTVSFTPTNYDMFIGRAENPLFPYWFNGIIDEIRIYNKALCDGEIKQLNKLSE